MKKLLFVLTILLVSCWSKTPDGREYRIKCNCLHEHSETETFPVVTLVNNVPTTTIQTQTNWVCDERVCDTVWRKK